MTVHHTALSLRLTEIGILRLVRVNLPEPGAGETILDVSYCALCRTDAKLWSSGHRDLSLPRTLGHEICGFKEGTRDLFVVWPGECCGVCTHCLSGAENLCPEMRILGFNRDGGLAEKVVVKEGSLIPVPTSLSASTATLAEPLGCTLNALEQARVSEGDKVLILGGGPVGLLMCLAVRAQRAVPFLVEPNRRKLLASETFRIQVGVEADHVVGTRVFDVAINATSAIESFGSGISALKTGGRYCLFSGLPQKDTVPASLVNEIHYRQLQVSGGYGCTRHQIREALQILTENKELAKLLIESEISLEDVSSAFPRILAGEAMKIVMRMQPD